MATVLQVIQTVQAEQGLPLASSVVSSTDPMVHQFKALLNGAGLELVKVFDWQVLQREHYFSTESGIPVYSLPTGWDRYIPGTDWDRSQSDRLVSTNPIQWSSIKWGSFGSAIDYRWRIRGNVIQIDPTPSAARNLVIDYITNLWVQSADASGSFASANADSDNVLLDFQLIVKLVKFKWLVAKGFDATAAKYEYEKRLNACKETDTPADTIRLDARSNDLVLIGNQNLAETGWGS